MAYRPDIPNQANLVRTASGDLALMQGNFNALAPIVSGTVVSGTLPSAAIRGFYFGDPTNRKRYFLQSDGSDVFQLMRNVSGESSPSWQAIFSASQVSGADVVFAMKVSGIDPTASGHFATKNYVDTVPTLSGLADTTITSPSSGDMLEWDGSGWVDAAHVHSLNDLQDVSIPSPASGEVLIHNGSQWGADALKLSQLSDVDPSGATSGQVLRSDGAGNWTADSLTLNRVVCVLSGAQTQSIPQTTYTTFSGDEVPVNVGGFTVSSGSITVPAAGCNRVDIVGQANWAVDAIGTDYDLEIMLNGAALSGLAGYNISAKDRRRKSTTSDTSNQNVTALDVPVTSGDVITMVLYQDGAAGGLNVLGGTGLVVRGQP
jgi:hypothetical protein